MQELHERVRLAEIGELTSAILGELDTAKKIVLLLRLRGALFPDPVENLQLRKLLFPELESQDETDYGTMSKPCYCPPGARQRCSPTDETHDIHGRELCCPYDNRAMAVYHRKTYWPGWEATPGLRAAMRKRLHGELEAIAQRAADTRSAT